ncbi:MAG: ATP-dependent helicase [Acidimicrobiia bacterium]
MFAITSPAAAEPGWAAGLNDRQRDAVEHGAGPLLVVAGAGSGKTRTLASRVARLIADGVPAERILLLTFTRRAAAEMIRRAQSMLRDATTTRIWGGTFHGVANRLLRRHASAIGLDPGFSIVDQTDAADLFALLRADAGLGNGKRRFPRAETIVAIYSRLANAQEHLDRVLEERFSWCSEHGDALRELFRGYVERKRQQNVVDYDDLLLYWKALLDSPVAGAVTSLFDHVLVDEFQDTNRVQGDIVHGLVGSGGNVTAVGDDAQAIYSFRAASIENIATFRERFDGVKVVTLEQNYRSRPQILAAANAVIAEASEVVQKELWSERGDGPRPELVVATDETAQAGAVCDRILEQRERGVSLRDQCVLFRTGHHSAGLEIELGRRDIPFVKFGGLRFLEAAHVKDVLAMLRMVENPRDELAWHRVLRLVPGIGPATARKIHARVVGAPGAAIEALAGLDVPLPGEARVPLAELGSALVDVASGEEPVAGQIERLLPFCQATFPEAYDDPGVRLGDVERLAALAGGSATRAAFLTDLVLDPPARTSDLADAPHLDDDYLILSTIHSAKGGEWRTVYVIHASDGNIPSDMSLGEPGGLAEERRLLYVALTRAKDTLTVLSPQRYYHARFGASGAHTYAPLTRFLDGPAKRAFDVTSAGEIAPEEASIPGSAGVDPVAGVLEALWA